MQLHRKALRAGLRHPHDRAQILALVAILLFVLCCSLAWLWMPGSSWRPAGNWCAFADAAALAGAGALSSGEPGEANDWLREQRAVARAREYARLNGFDPDAAGNVLDVDVSFAGRKVVTVNASRSVGLAFMRLIGINSATVRAHAEGARPRRRRGHRPRAGRLGIPSATNNMPPGKECAYILGIHHIQRTRPTCSNRTIPPRPRCATCVAVVR
jgi:hypothetical protein